VAALAAVQPKEFMRQDAAPQEAFNSSLMNPGSPPVFASVSDMKLAV
jgi:hypothetical protein